MDNMRRYLKQGSMLTTAVLLCIALILTGGQAVRADGIYEALIYSPEHPGYSKTVNFTTFEDLFATIEADPPTNYIPGFDPAVDALKADTNYGGALVTMDIPVDTPTVLLEVPALGISESFEGDTLEAAVVATETYVADDPEGTMAALDEYVEEISTPSVVAGGDSDSNLPCFISTICP